MVAVLAHRTCPCTGQILGACQGSERQNRPCSSTHEFDATEHHVTDDFLRGSDRHPAELGDVVLALPDEVNKIGSQRSHRLDDDLPDSGEVGWSFRSDLHHT